MYDYLWRVFEVLSNMARWIYTPPHRQNTDGTFDSICPVCSLMLGTRDREADLVEVERQHTCIQFLLKHLPIEE
jgi:hypothetical protein